MLKKVLVLLVFVAVAYIRVASAQDQDYVADIELDVADLRNGDEALFANSSASTPLSTASTEPTNSTVLMNTTISSHTTVPTNTTATWTSTESATTQAQGAHFDVGSFLGGILVGAVVVVVIYLIYYFAYARKRAQGNSYEHFG